MSDLIGREAVECRLDLLRHEVDVGVRLADFKWFSAADDRRDARRIGSLGTLVDTLVRLAEVLAAFGVAEHAVVDTDLLEHRRRNLARIGAALLPMYVLCADVDVRAFDGFCHSGERRCRRASDDIDILCILHERHELLDERYALGDRIVHLPVACDDGSSCHKIFLLV